MVEERGLYCRLVCTLGTNDSYYYVSWVCVFGPELLYTFSIVFYEDPAFNGLIVTACWLEFAAVICDMLGLEVSMASLRGASFLSAMLLRRYITTIDRV